MAGDDNAVDIFGVLLIGEKSREDLGELVKRGPCRRLDRGGAEIEQHAFAQHDRAVVSDGDLARVAHDRHHAVAHLLQDRQAQHGDRLHAAAHLQQLAVGGLEVFLLLADQRLLIRQQLVLCGQLILPLGQLAALLGQLGVLLVQRALELVERQSRLVEVDGDLFQVAFRLVHLGERQLQGAARLSQDLLRAAQIVAGDEVLDIAQKHQEKQDQRDGRHHVGVGRPKALLAGFRAHKGVAACLVAPFHLLSPPMRRLISRMAADRSRTHRSMRSTLPRRL